MHPAAAAVISTKVGSPNPPVAIPVETWVEVKSGEVCLRDVESDDGHRPGTGAGTASSEKSIWMVARWFVAGLPEGLEAGAARLCLSWNVWKGVSRAHEIFIFIVEL